MGRIGEIEEEELFLRNWAAAFLLKLEILLIVRMSSGRRLYYFAPRKAKDRVDRPVGHL